MSQEADLGTDQTRRLVLKAVLAASFAGMASASGFLPAQAADASKWPQDAFKQKGEADAIKALFGKSAEPSDKVKLDAPEIAENGAVVSISVASTLPDVTTIALLVSENPNTLAAAYRIPPGTAASVANRLKLAKTSNIVAVVESGGKLYSATKEVKVTVGGCGG